MKKYAPIVLLVILIAVRVFTIFDCKGALTDDERAHWAYAKYVGTEKNLPYFAFSKMYSDSIGSGVYWYENYQLPAFYMAAAPFAIGGISAARLFSLFLWIAGVGLLWEISRQWWLLLFLALPGSIIVSSMVTNQSLEFLGASLLAYAMCRDKNWLLMVAGVVFCLAKVTGIAVCGLLCIYYLMKNPSKVPWLIPGIVLGSYLSLDRFSLYAVDGKLLQGIGDLTRNLGHSLVTGLLDPMWPKSDGLLGVGIALLIVSAFLVKRHWKWFLSSEYAIAASAVLVVFLVFIESHGFGNGRLLYPAVPFFVVNKGTLGMVS
jgi:hypothetical protein